MAGGVINHPTLTSNKNDWETPPEIFDPLNAVFNFDIDVCATAENTKCQRYYTPEIDGLKQPWHNNEVCWCNPPYGRAIQKWIRKAVDEAAKGASVVCLITARPDTTYWHDMVFPYARAICFVRGRLKFVGAKHSAPFPSAIVVFSPRSLEQQQLRTLAGFGQLVVCGMMVR